MADKLTRSTAHLMPPDPRIWAITLAWWRIQRRRAEQLRLELEEKR